MNEMNDNVKFIFGVYADDRMALSSLEFSGPEDFEWESKYGGLSCSHDDEVAFDLPLNEETLRNLARLVYERDIDMGIYSNKNIRERWYPLFVIVEPSVPYREIARFTVSVEILDPRFEVTRSTQDKPHV